jgi:hypothetical protein
MCLSHPFVERLIGAVRRELLDRVPFWGARDLERKLRHYRDYYNHGRVHASLEGSTPLCPTDHECDRSRRLSMAVSLPWVVLAARGRRDAQFTTDTSDGINESSQWRSALPRQASDECGLRVPAHCTACPHSSAARTRARAPRPPCSRSPHLAVARHARWSPL